VPNVQIDDDGNEPEEKRELGWKRTASSESPRKQIAKTLLSAGWCGEGIGEMSEKEILCKRVSLQARAITITSMLSHLECEMARSISVASIMFERVWLPFKFAKKFTHAVATK
jgi:hypothetical protein